MRSFERKEYYGVFFQLEREEKIMFFGRSFEPIPFPAWIALLCAVHAMMRTLNQKKIEILIDKEKKEVY